jgi:tellurite resistance protein TehA-like permease
MTGGGIFLIILFGALAIAAIFRTISARKEKKNKEG